jgi:hypothetical protein
MRLRAAFILVTALLFARAALGQEDNCPLLVEQALKVSRDACITTGRNQACYGHDLLKAEPSTGITNFEFNRIGDKTSVDSIGVMRLSPFDRSNNSWGVAIMRLQADLPHTLPGQNVTFVMFGDVAVVNQVARMPFTVDVTASRGINVRGLPRIDAPVVGVAPKGKTLVADGRLSDGSWLRVRVPYGPQSIGWVRSDMVAPAGDVAGLDVTSADDSRPRYQPMQAFYLTTGRNSAACKQVPENGVLIQSPHGAGKVNLLINNVNIRIGSTVLFQAEPGNKMTVTTLEGEALVSVKGRQVKAPTGWRVSIPMDEGLNPVAPPSAPEPLNPIELKTLPVQILDSPVVVQPPASSGVSSNTPMVNSTAVSSYGSIGGETTNVIYNPPVQAATAIPVVQNSGGSNLPVPVDNPNTGSSGSSNTGNSIPTNPPPVPNNPPAPPNPPPSNPGNGHGHGNGQGGGNGSDGGNGNGNGNGDGGGKGMGMGMGKG